MSAHSPYSNCEEDVNTICLDNLREFLCREYIAGVQSVDSLAIENTSHIPETRLYKKVKVSSCITTYISGYVARFLLKYFGNCRICNNNICFQENTNLVDHDYITSREFNKSKLTKPGSFLKYSVTHSLDLLFYWIPRLCNKPNLVLYLTDLLNRFLNTKPLDCPKHAISKKFISFIITCALYWWCKSINKILKGKDSKFINFLANKPNFHVIDPMKVLTNKKYNSKLKRKRKNT